MSCTLLSKGLLWANYILARDATQHWEANSVLGDCSLISFDFSSSAEFIAHLFIQEDHRDILLAVQQINLVFLCIDKTALLSISFSLSFQDELMQKIQISRFVLIIILPFLFKEKSVFSRGSGELQVPSQ